ncbi:MAG: DUF1638 domain-containing protein [Woeseiaceae bacterium]
MPEPILVIACGALAREINDLRKTNGWDHLDLASIDAWLHNRPDRIPDRLRSKIRQFKKSYSNIFIAYADCGTGGGIDKVLAEEGVDRLPGAHCYEFFAGEKRFAALADAEPGTYYLTDFLARHFERFVIRPLKLDTHPELRDSYFGNYRRLVYLSQSHDEELLELAKAAADQLGLRFEHIHCGFGELESGLSGFVANTANG